MVAVSDDLGRVAWKRGIKGQTPVFTNAFKGRDTLSCLRIAVFQSVKGGLRRKRGKDFFPHISWGKKVIYEMDRRYSKRYRQTFPSDKAHKGLPETFQAIGLSSLHLRGVKGL